MIVEAALYYLETAQRMKSRNSECGTYLKGLDAKTDDLGSILLNDPDSSVQKYGPFEILEPIKTPLLKL